MKRATRCGSLWGTIPGLPQCPVAGAREAVRLSSRGAGATTRVERLLLMLLLLLLLLLLFLLSLVVAGPLLLLLLRLSSAALNNAACTVEELEPFDLT